MLCLSESGFAGLKDLQDLKDGYAFTADKTIRHVHQLET